MTTEPVQESFDLPVLVDTGYGLRGRCEFLLHWRHVADCRVQAVAIVELHATRPTVLRLAKR